MGLRLRPQIEFSCSKLNWSYFPVKIQDGMENIIRRLVGVERKETTEMCGVMKSASADSKILCSSYDQIISGLV